MCHANDVQVLALQEPNVRFGKRARLPSLLRYRASGRIDRQPAEENWPPIQGQLTIARFEAPKTETNRSFGSHSGWAAGRYRDGIQSRARRAPNLRFQPRDCLSRRIGFPDIKDDLPKQTLPEWNLAAKPDNAPLQINFRGLSP